MGLVFVFNLLKIHEYCCFAPMWFKSFHSESFSIQFRIWNNSLSWFMCSTSRTSISPIRITSHRNTCYNQHLLSSNNSNKSCVQQSSTIHIEPNLYKRCGCHGVMFSELSNPTYCVTILCYHLTSN